MATRNKQERAEVERAAYKIVDLAMNSELPDFIAERLLQLKILLQMLNEADWKLSDQDHERNVLFCRPDRPHTRPYSRNRFSG